MSACIVDFCVDFCVNLPFFEANFGKTEALSLGSWNTTSVLGHTHAELFVPLSPEHVWPLRMIPSNHSLT